MSTQTLSPARDPISSPTDTHHSTSVLAVANHFIRIGAECIQPPGFEITHMRVQKLCYHAYGHHLRVFGERLCPEHPELWPRGPGFLSLYLALQHAGQKPLGALIVTPYGTPTIRPDSRHDRFLRTVSAHYAGTTTPTLAERAHRPDSAWARTAAAQHHRCAAGTIIPDGFIGEDYARGAIAW